MREEGRVATASGVALPLGRELPTGTVTFVFTDIEGSTRLTGELGTERWHEVLEQHAAVIRDASRRHEGVQVRTEGDSFFLAFRTARQAVAAAADMQRGLARQPWRHGAMVKVRIGMHTGENAVPGTPESGADYVGNDVVRAARIAAAAHGGQVLISSATRTLLGDELPAGVSLLDLGEHRLKGLAQPDRISQLVIEEVPSAFPTLRTLSSAPNNLPLQLTSFIGRRRELAEARALLDGTRLLTLVGPGGTGKSRLSLELAANVVSSFEDGVWFVRLAAVTDPGLVASQIAQTLGLVVPAAVTPLQHVISHLRDKRALLVLDNFEQVVGAAGDLGEILRECSGVKAVVTTRIVLHVAGEQEYPVPPLTLPDPNAVPDVAALARAEAIQLFLERARAARPDFMLTSENARPVVGIVAQLDGLPLAIELAAARVKILAPHAILERLASGLGLLQSSARDVPARQQTLRGAIAWSYDLLDPGLGRLLQRLSVFRGGAALTQIEQVCGPSDEIGRDVLDGVSELVDQSLLRRAVDEGEPRFNMLETIREFAREKLDESGEAPVIELRHAKAFLALAESMGPDLFGPKQKERLDRFGQEQGNLRVALDICDHPVCADRASCDCGPTDHAADDERTDVSLRLAGALWRFWQMRGHLHEARQRTERILALPGADRHPEAYLRALEAAGGITYWLGDLEPTERTYIKRLDLARQVGDVRAVADALYDLAFVYIVPSRGLDQAKALLEDSLALFRGIPDRGGEAKVMWALSTTYMSRGMLDEAAAHLPQVVQAFRDLHNRFGLGWALHNLGVLRIRQGRPEDARGHLAEALGIFRDSGDFSGIVLLLLDFAEMAAALARDELGLRLFGAANALAAKTGAMLGDVMRDENTIYAISGREMLARTGQAMKDRLIAEGAAMSMDDAIALALAPQGAPA